MWNERILVDNLIVYSDDDIIISNKPSGIPVVPDKSNDLAFKLILENYLGYPLYPINRIDRPVSGAVIWGKTPRAQHLFAERFTVSKWYLAIVSPIRDSHMILRHYIRKDGQAHKARVSDQPLDGFKPCQLTFNKILSLDSYDVLNIQLQSGRFHQIRAQLAHYGAPIKGDIKYGARRKNADRSIDLHAYRVIFNKTSVVAPILRKDKIWIDIDASLPEFVLPDK